MLEITCRVLKKVLKHSITHMIHVLIKLLPLTIWIFLKLAGLPILRNLLKWVQYWCWSWQSMRENRWSIPEEYGDVEAHVEYARHINKTGAVVNSKWDSSYAAWFIFCTYTYITENLLIIKIGHVSHWTHLSLTYKVPSSHLCKLNMDYSCAVKGSFPSEVRSRDRRNFSTIL